ncbi:MAG: prepilin-type N-terminal cleavage/methylation domain-containing protein [Candidatus Gracilibacteria bacterium]
MSKSNINKEQETKCIKKRKTGFTLVELIVVITILAILGTIAFISFQNYSSNARDGVRIADLNSIKKNLELFITDKGFYPTPDNVTNITYSGAIAWSQGTVGDNVITNLARLNKKPTDPLTNSEYTYSITNAKTEYQLSSINEGGLSYDIPLTNQTYAATLKTATAKVTGSYNEKLLKVSTGGIDYILAVPSIINTDLSIKDLPSIINNKQLVYNNYQNLPDSYKNTGYTMTGGFNFAPPSNIIEVYTGSLANLTSSGTIQQQFVTKLQSIYNGTIIQSEPTIKEILNATTSTQQQTLVGNYITNHVGGITGTNTVVIQTQTYSCSGALVIANATITNTTGLTSNTNYQTTNSANSCYYTCKTSYSGTNCDIYTDPAYIACTGVGQIKTATTTYGTCNTADIIVCAGTNTGYTIAACNIGTSIAGTGTSSYGYYFQWGNNYGSVAGGPTITTLVDASGYNPPNYYSSTGFILTGGIDWTITKNDNLWGDTYNTPITRQGPCITGYHIPTKAEFIAINTAGLWGATLGTNLSNTLKLPQAGYRNNNGSTGNVGACGMYGSSSINGVGYGNTFQFCSNDIYSSSNALRSRAFTIRCIKN